MRESVQHPGELIHHEEDDLGKICVYERDGKRYLTFGNRVEQSCFNPARPWQLEHEYTQGMMLGVLLQEEVRSALVLGLGGGTLVHALRHVRPQIEIEAVDCRMGIIRIAQEFFAVIPDRKLHLHCDDAERFIRHHHQAHDLILVDLYLAEGAHAAQQCGEFLGRCREQLSENGVLLINQWCGTQREADIARQATGLAFGESVLHLHISGGNQVACCFNSALPKPAPKRLFGDARKLGMQLGIPLERLARNFWRQNAAALKLGALRGKHPGTY
jgi:spermidine synthase